MNKKDFEGKQRFSIRKLTIGACSVLLGTLLWTATDEQIVHADTMGRDAPTEEESNSEQKRNESALINDVTNNGADLDNKVNTSISNENKGESAPNSENKTVETTSTEDASSTQTPTSSSSDKSLSSQISSNQNNSSETNKTQEIQKNESITSTDTSAAKETEQKANENKDQSQSAQNNQNTNVVKNVNNTNGTNQAATSTKENAANGTETTTLDTSKITKNSTDVKAIAESKDSTEDITPIPYSTVGHQGDMDMPWAVAGSDLSSVDPSIYFKNASALKEAGATFSWVGTPDTLTNAQHGQLGSATVKVTYQDGKSVDVNIKFHTDAQLNLIQHNSAGGYNFYYVKNIGDTVTSFDTPDANGMTLYNPNDWSHSLLGVTNTRASTDPSQDLSKTIKIEPVGNIDTSTAGIHFAEFKVTSHLKGTGSQTGFDYIPGTYIVKVPYIVQGLKVRDDIPKDAAGNPIINAQLSYTNTSGQTVSGFNPSTSAETLGQYFYQDYGEFYALGITTSVLNWTAPTDLKNTTTNHFTLHLNGVTQADQDVDVKYATNPRVDDIYFFNQGKNPNIPYISQQAQNRQFLYKYFGSDNNSDAGKVDIDGQTISSTSVIKNPGLTDAQAIKGNWGQGKVDLTLAIEFAGVNSADQPLVFSDGTFKNLTNNDYRTGEDEFLNEANDFVNKVYLANGNGGSTLNISKATPTIYTNLQTKGYALYPSQPTNKVVDITDGIPKLIDANGKPEESTADPVQTVLSQVVYNPPVGRDLATGRNHPNAIQLSKDANGNTIWPAGTTFTWHGSDGSDKLVLDKAGITKTGDVTVKLGSTETSWTVKGVSITTRAQVKTQNKTVEYGERVSAADLVANKDVFPAGTTFSFVDGTEPDWTKPDTYKNVQIKATYQSTDKNGKKSTVTTDAKTAVVAIDGFRRVTVLQGSEVPTIDQILNLPSGWAEHTSEWTQNINTNETNQGEITVHYPSSGLNQTVKIYVTVIGGVSVKNGLEFKTNGDFFDGSTGNLSNNGNGDILINNPGPVHYKGYETHGEPGEYSTITENDNMSYTPTYTVSGLRTNADGSLVSGPQTATITVSVPEGDASTVIASDGSKSIKLKANVVIAQPVTFEFVDDDSSNSAVVGTPQTQEFIKGTTDLDSNVKTNLTVPNGYELASGQTIPKSYTLVDYSTTNPVVQIHLVHKKTVTVENQTKSATVHYINGTTGQAMGSDAPDASWTAYYTRNKTVDLATNQTTYSDWKLDTSKGTNGISETGSWTVDAATGNVTITVPTVTGYTAYDANNKKVTSVTLTPTDKGATATVTYEQSQSVSLKFVDDDNHEAQVGSTVTEQGLADHTDTFTLGLPTNYQLVDNQTGISLNSDGKVAVSYKFTSADDQAVTIHLKHKTENVSATDPQAQETRTITVKYINAATGQSMGTLAPDAVMDVYYKRSATKDLVTGAVTYGDWQWDSNRDHGYKVISGTWGVPTVGVNLWATTPTVAGYTAIEKGNWEKNSNGSIFTDAPANRFCSPDWSGNIAYLSSNPYYDCTPTHIVYFAPDKAIASRTLTVNYKYWENGQDAGNAFDPAHVTLNYTQRATAYNSETRTITYSDDYYVSYSDVSAPTGSNWSNIDSNNQLGDEQIGIPQPTIDGYTAIVSGSNNTSVGVFGAPNGYKNDHTVYTKADDSDWSYRPSLTVFYVKNSDLQKSVTRTINVTKPGETSPTTTTQEGIIKRTATLNKDDNGVQLGDWTSTQNWAEQTVSSFDGYTTVIKQVVTNPDGTTTETTIDSIPAVTIDDTTKPTTINVTYTANTQSVKINFVDDDNKGETVSVTGDPTTEEGPTDSTGTFTYTLPSKYYELATGQQNVVLQGEEAKVTYKFTAAENQTVTIHLKHQIQNVTDPDVIQQTRTIRVNFIDAATGQPMGTLAPDAAMDVYYKRTATKDLVTGYTTYGTWQWDTSRDHGYKVVSGSWNTPASGQYVIATIPSVNGYTSVNQGIWEKNSDGGRFYGIANRFCAPDWSGDKAYLSTNFWYDTTPTHTVYYVPNNESRDITVLKDSAIPAIDSILNLPAGTPAHTTSWILDKEINTSTANQGEINIHYTDSGINQTVKVNVKVVPKLTAKNGIEFTTNGNLYDGTTGSIKNGDNEGQILINTPSESLGYTPTYSVSGLHYDSNGKLVSGNQTATIRISVPKGVFGAQTDSKGNSYYEVTSNIVVAQPVTFEFVDDDNESTVVGNPQTQEFIKGITTNLDSNVKKNLTVPENYQLVTGQSVPTSYTLADYSATNPVVQIHLKHKMLVTNETETRTLTVNYVNASTGQAMEGLTPAQLQVFYKRSATKDLVTNKVTYGNWQWDTSQGNNGYNVLSGDWTLPSTFDNVIAKVPTVSGYTVFTKGDWEKNKNGNISDTAANEFVFPTYDGHAMTTGDNSVAYTDDSPVYEGTATHTIYFAPTQVQGRVITEHYKKYNADGTYSDANVVEMPDGSKQSSAQIKVWYQKTATGFATNGSTDHTKWTINYSDWSWDQAAGDTVTPGYTVISGGYTGFDGQKHGQGLWGITNDGGSSWGIGTPTLNGYTAITASDDNEGYHSISFAGPAYGSVYNGSAFTDNKNSNWLYRNDLTTFYVPNDLLRKNVTRTINIHVPASNNVVTVTQTVTFERTARINKGTDQDGDYGDTKIVFGGITGSDVASFVAGAWNHTASETEAHETFAEFTNGESADSNIVKTGYTAYINGQPVTSVAALTITPDAKDSVVDVTYSATATAKLTGNGSATYTGKPITTDDLNNSTTGLKITVTGPTADAGTLALNAGDVEFSTDGTTWTTTLPTNADTYQVRLTTQGENAIKSKYGNANIVWTEDGHTTITSDAKFTINPLSANSVLNNLTEGNYTKVYDGSATTSVDPTKLGATVQLNGQTVNLDMTGLTGADFQWVDADGNAIANPQNVGTYHIKLTTDGLTVLQAHNKNFTLTNSGLGTYTITQAQASGKLDGSNFRTYNGQATTTAEVNNNGQIVVTVTFPGATAANNKYTLKNGDYTWNTTDGNAPTDAGDYIITLNATGISNIENYILGLTGKGQNNTSNVTFKNSDFTGSAKYTINKADATATIGGSHERTYNGQPISGTEVYGEIAWTGHDITNNVNFDLSHQISASDYAWYTKNSNGEYVKFTGNGTPVNAGTYYLILNPDYATKLNQANPNYNVSITKDAAFTYIIDKAKATVTISGSQNDKYNGSPVTIDYSNFPVSITTNNGETITAPSGAKLTANDIIITDSKGNVVTDPTKIDTYTVKLTPAGLQKFESQTDNYDWVSAGTGILSITRNTDTSVKLDGNESVVYTGNTAKINPSSFHVVLGNGETYTLQDGDLQFVDQTTGANTNAGHSYQVELSDQGRRNIALVDADNYGYDFTNVGTGSVTVTKATPSASMSGTVGKRYDGTPISGYLPTITITAPGNNSVTLTSGDFEWTKDGQTYTTAPSDAGTYTVTLTPTGLAKVKAVNSQNLDWSNVQVTGNVTYKIDKANAIISIPSERTETAIWNGHTVTVDPSKFVPAITSDNPNAANISLPDTLTLTDGDYQFVQGGRVISAPSEVGTYQVQLTENGWHKVRDAITGKTNYNWTYQGKGTYKIDKANATITLNGSGSTIYTGSSAVIPSENGTVTGITVTLSNGQTYDLKPEDLEFVNDQGHKIDAPTDAGTYKVRLSSTAIGKISGLEDNHYNYTYNDGTVNFIINKANADVTLSQTQTNSYTGGVISPDANKFAITINTNNGQTLTYGLQSGDITTSVENSTNVGSYDVVLTDDGKTHIQGLNSNYNYNFVDSHGTLQITQAQATATLSGQGTRVYNGEAVTVDDLNAHNATNNITLTLHYPKDGNANYSTTVTLTADDFVWNTPDGNAPVDANSTAYTLSLKSSVIKALLEQTAGSGQDNLSNVSVADSDITGTASYTITPLQSTATVSNVETGNYGKTYDAQVTDQIDPAKLHITTTVNGETVELDTTHLTGDDFVWVDGNGTPLVATDYPKNVGTYYIALNGDGLAQLQADNPNFNLTSAGRGIYTISQAQGEAKLVGNNSKTYNGSAISIAEINSNGQIVVNLTFPGSGNTASYTLQSGDYTITPADASNTNLANVGTYTITLTADGKKHIAKRVEMLSGTGQGNKANATIAESSITGNATFTINASANVVGVSGTQIETYTGQPINVVYNEDGNNSVTVSVVSATGSSANIGSVQLASGDFKLVDASGDPITATDAGGVYHIILTDAGITKIQNKVGKNYKITQSTTNFGKLVINKASASATFTGNPTYTYTGSANSNYLNGFTVTLNEPGNPTYNLQDGDIEFNVNGTWTKNVPINKGVYDVRLSTDGWTHIKNINKDNVNWTESPTAGTGTYTINAATATTELSGQNSMTYSGNAVTTADLYTDGSTIKVAINGSHITGLPTEFTLEDGDYTWTTSDNSAPKNVGHYSIILSDTGFTKIQDAIDQAVGAGNVVLSRENTGTAEFRITQAVSQNIQLDGHLKKQYDGQKANFDPTNAETKANYEFNNVLGLTIPNLTTADFEWVDSDGNAITDPTNVGYYYLQLNETGKKAIADANPNYAFVNKDGQSVISGRITYHIYPATLEIGVSGTASKVYNGETAKITQAQLDSGQIKLVWGNSTSEPTDLGGFTLTPDDLEVVDENGKAVDHANVHDNSATGNPVYYVRLTSDALNRIKQLTGATNYDIGLSNSTGTYLIYAHKAQVTLRGNQSTPYGTELALDPTKYVIDLTNWTKDAPVPTNAEILRAIGGLKPGDVYINGYATADKMPNGQMPTDVGSYQVMISSQLLTKLKNAFPDYDWDAVGETNGVTRSGGSDSDIIEAEHDPARYIITPAVTTVTINGAQHIKYGEATTIKYGDGGYTITITAPVKNATTDNPAQPIYTTKMKLTDGDLEFVSTPGKVGSYEVKLSAQGIRKLNQLTGSTNYDWTQASKARANFFVDQMPVTITVGGDPQTVTYGSTDWLDAIKKDLQGNVYPRGYTLNVKTEDGDTLTYTAQDGDLVFTQLPGNVGSYEVKLSDQGLEHIKTALGTNYAYPQVASDVTTYGIFKVEQDQVTVTLSGHDDKTYNGQATTPANLDTRKYGLTYSATIYAPDGTSQTITLEPSDLQFVGGNPINAGHYDVELSQSGKDRLAALTGNNGKNYEWTFKTKATYDINAATEASAKLTGSNQKEFDGSAVTTAQINNGGNILVHFTFPGSSDSSTYQLQDGDYTWAGGSAPTNVGTYTINLTSAGLTHLQNAINAIAGSGNVTLSADSLSGSATFEITPKPITNVTISGDNQHKTYDGQAADLDVGRLTISGSGTVANTPLSDEGITADDFVWNTADGKAPTNAGHYEARLKPSVLNTLQGKNKNYSFDAVNGTIEYTINPKAVTETLGNVDSKNYDGNGVSVSDVLGKLTWTPGEGDEVEDHGIDLSGLTANDYEWYTKNADGSYTPMTGEPTDAGTYYLKLKDGSIDKIKNANPNYSFAANAIKGEFTYTINKANAEITLPSTSSQTITWTGNSATLDPSKFVPTITSDNPNAANISLPSTLNLTADDYQFLQGGVVIATPSEVGTYQVELTENGWHKIRDAVSGNTNYKWTYSGKGTYQINKADATITLNGSSSTVYSGSPVVIPSQSGAVTGITVTLSNGQTYTLNPTDLEFVNDQGERIDNPTDVGHYKVRLTDPAITTISEIDSDHYNYTYDKGTVNFDITQMPVTITVGDKTNVPSVIYGEPINLDPSDYTMSIKTDNGQTLNYTPVAGDLQFVDGTPTATGTYEVVLSSTGLQHIRDKFGIKNYTYSSNGQGSFIVEAATAGIKIIGSDSKLYDGEAATITPSDYSLEITTNNGQTINIPINAGDLVFSDGSVPVDANTYNVTLSQSAFDKIKREYANYNWNTPVAGTYTINKATATVTTGNSWEVTYNGQTPAIDLGKITNTIATNNGVEITVPTLSSDDFEWVDANGNSIADPVNVGTYYLKLKDASHSKISTNNNYDWYFNGLASVTINKANATITFGGTDSETYTGSTITPNVDKFTITLPNGVTYALTGNDIQVIGNPVNVGNYKVELKKSTVDAINEANGNYNLTYDGSQGTLNIVPADITATIGGTQTTKTPAADPNKFTVTVNGHKVDGLTKDDFIFSKDGHPVGLTKAGTYDVELSGDMINKIRQDNPNYHITFTSTATLTLENSSQTINYVDKDNNVIGTTTVGNDIEGTKVSFDPKAPAGWKLTDPTKVPNEITLSNGITTIQVEHNIITVTPGEEPKPGDKKPGNPDKEPGDGDPKTDITYDDLHKAMTRTINVTDPHTGLKTTIETLNYERIATFDDVTGEVTYGTWTVAQGSKAGFDNFNIPSVPGYTAEITSGTANELKAMTPSQDQISNWTDETIDIDYTANDQSMHIIYEDTNGTTIKDYQVSGKTDQTVDTNATIPTGWVLENGQSDAPKSITFTGTPTKDIIIKIKHGMTNVPHTDPIPENGKTPTGKPIDGAHEDDLNQTITRTINVTTPDGKTTSEVQTAHIHRDATYDDVTGEVTYGAWSEDTNSWKDFKPSVIAGYTPSQVDVPAATVKDGMKDQMVNITYTANEQTGKIIYQDVDNHNVEVGHTDLTGKTGETIAINPDVPAGFDIVPGQNIPASETATADGIPTVTIKVSHHMIIVTPGEEPKPGDKKPGNPDKKPGDGDPKTDITYDDLHKAMTRTINVTDPHDGLKTTKVTLNYERTATIDDVTGAVTYSDWTVAQGSKAGFDNFNIPAVPGYTAEITSGTANELKAMTPTQDQISNWTNETIDIDYTANDQSMHIIYEDTDGHTIHDYKVSGKTDQTVDTNAKVPTGWKLAEGETAAPKTITFGGTPTADITIKIVHDTTLVPHTDPVPENGKTPTGKPINGAHEDDLNKTITRTINVTTPDGKTTSEVQTAHIHRDATYDDVTGEVTYGSWSTDKWDVFTPDTISGYTPTKQSVSAVTVDDKTKSVVVDITYTANDQTGKISYQDDQGHEISSTPLSGKTDEDVDIPTPEAPAGWKIVPGQDIPKTVKATAKGVPTVVVKIEHATITVTPDTDPKDIPTGPVPDDPNKTYEKMDNLTVSPTRTIIVKKPDGTTETITQVVNFTRTATFDEVTGKVTYSDWKFKSSSARDDKADWDAYTPETISGYTADPAEVAAADVTSDTSDTTITITYTRKNNGGGGNVTPPDVEPTEPNKPTQPTGQPTDQPKPSTPVQPTEPNKPTEPGNKTTPANKPGKPSKPEKPGKGNEKNNSSKNEHLNRHAHGYLKNGPTNAEMNAGLHGENNPAGQNGPISPSSDEQAIGPKSALFNHGAHATNGNKQNAKKKELPQTGSAHEGPLAWLGSLFAGLSLFGLASDRKRKKKDDK